MTFYGRGSLGCGTASASASIWRARFEICSRDLSFPGALVHLSGAHRLNTSHRTPTMAHTMSNHWTHPHTRQPTHWHTRPSPRAHCRHHRRRAHSLVADATRKTVEADVVVVGGGEHARQGFRQLANWQPPPALVHKQHVLVATVRRHHRAADLTSPASSAVVSSNGREGQRPLCRRDRRWPGLHLDGPQDTRHSLLAAGSGQHGLVAADSAARPFVRRCDRMAGGCVSVANPRAPLLCRAPSASS